MGCEARPGEPSPGAAGAGCAPAGATEREGPWEPDAVREAGPVAGKRTASTRAAHVELRYMRVNGTGQPAYKIRGAGGSRDTFDSCVGSNDH